MEFLEIIVGSKRVEQQASGSDLKRTTENELKHNTAARSYAEKNLVLSINSADAPSLVPSPNARVLLLSGSCRSSPQKKIPALWIFF